VDIKWQDPAPPRGGTNATRKWDEIRAALKGRPGEWALVAEMASAPTAQYQTRPGFEFTTRSVPGYPARRVDIYARYVGQS
jgi:hypothetical protein